MNGSKQGRLEAGATNGAELRQFEYLKWIFILSHVWVSFKFHLNSECAGFLVIFCFENDSLPINYRIRALQLTRIVLGFDGRRGSLLSCWQSRPRNRMGKCAFKKFICI